MPDVAPRGRRGHPQAALDSLTFDEMLSRLDPRDPPARPRRREDHLRALAEADLGPLLGSGARSSVYALADGRAVKLFRPSARLNYVGAEFTVTRAVREAGGPAWRVDEIVRFRDRLGIVGERVEGETFTLALQSGRMSLRAALRALLAVHDALIPMTAVAPSTFRERRFDRFIASVAAPPAALERRGVCHGDLSFDNLMIDRDGRTVVVDWSSAFHGPVLADVAIANRAIRGALSRPGSPLRHRLAKHAVVFAHRYAICRRMGWPLMRFAAAAFLVATLAPPFGMA